MHNTTPSVALASRWLDDLGLYNAAELLAIVDRSPQVRAVLAGHVHQASDVVRNGCVAWTLIAR